MTRNLPYEETRTSGNDDMIRFKKTLNKLMNKARLQNGGCTSMKPLASIIHLILISVLPTLFQDMVTKANKWGNDGASGRIDPFTEIFDASIFLTKRSPFESHADFSFPARFLHDRPYGHVSRYDKE